VSVAIWTISPNSLLPTIEMMTAETRDCLI
jgi:hypothetical protein